MRDRNPSVLFVHSSNELYGADNVLFNLLDRRARERWDVYVLLPNDVPYAGLLSKKLVACGIPYEELKLAVLRRRYYSLAGFPRYSAFFVYSVAAIIRRIRRFNFDVIHSNTLAVVPGAVAARLTKKPHVWHCHEIVSSPRVLGRILSKLAVNLSEVVVAVSDAVRRNILEDEPQASNVKVIYNGIDVCLFHQPELRPRIRSELGFTKDDVVVGLLGRISRFKGQIYLVDAASCLRKCSSLRFLIVGDPFVGQESVYDDLVARINRYRLSDRVVLSKFRNDAPALYAGMDISVSASIGPEAFGLVILESMAAGKPVVATDHGGSREMVVDGETGFLVPVDDASVMADRLRLLAESPDLRQRMGDAGRRRAEELFTRERMVREFWALMEEVVARR
ncbi:MAG: glycosyl transferase [Armatimonadota bacterium]|nr:MAG: glycosyl transferase [Armatimonadota bacterium]